MNVQYRPVIVMLLLASILSVWGFNKQAGYGLIGAGVFKLLEMCFK